MKIKPVQLTEIAWELHEAEALPLLSLIAELYSHFGYNDPFADGSEWTIEKAESRLREAGVLTPVARATVRAWDCANRSLTAARSKRERLLALLLPLRARMREVAEAAESYHEQRPSEVEFEKYLDRVIGSETIHCAEREILVAEKLRAWQASAEAMRQATDDLCSFLHQERPVTLEVGIYSGNGSGVRGEFGLRMMQRGIHHEHAALIRSFGEGTPVFRESGCGYPRWRLSRHFVGVRAFSKDRARFPERPGCPPRGAVETG